MGHTETHMHVFSNMHRRIFDTGQRHAFHHVILVKTCAVELHSYMRTGIFVTNQSDDFGSALLRFYRKMRLYNHER